NEQQQQQQQQQQQAPARMPGYSPSLDLRSTPPQAEPRFVVKLNSERIDTRAMARTRKQHAEQLSQQQQQQHEQQQEQNGQHEQAAQAPERPIVNLVAQEEKE